MKNHPRVVNPIISSITSVFSEGIYRGDLPSLCRNRKRRDILTLEELSLLLQPDTFSNRLAYQVCYTAAFTGMRCSEILALHWDQLEEDILTIDRAWVATYELSPPKWGKQRSFPLPESVLQILPEVNPDRPDLIFQKNNVRLGNTWWENNFNAAVEKAGIMKEVTPHCLRHSLHSHLLVNGVSPILIQEYLGWSRGNDLTKTQTGYTHTYLRIIFARFLRQLISCIHKSRREFHSPGNLTKRHLSNPKASIA